MRIMQSSAGDGTEAHHGHSKHLSRSELHVINSTSSQASNILFVLDTSIPPYITIPLRARNPTIWISLRTRSLDVVEIEIGAN